MRDDEVGSSAPRSRCCSRVMSFVCAEIRFASYRGWTLGVRSSSANVQRARAGVRVGGAGGVGVNLHQRIGAVTDPTNDVF